MRRFPRATELAPTTAKLHSPLVENWVNISVNLAYSFQAKNRIQYVKHSSFFSFLV